jgi:alcohol dehydrogenase
MNALPHRIRARAAVLRQVGVPMAIEMVEVGPLRPGDVLVKVAAASLCHTDLEVIEGQLGLQLPAVLGHETAGHVAALGEGVTALAVGDPVVLSWNPHCGHCFQCSRGQPILCEPFLANGPRALHFDGAPRLACDDGSTLHQLMYLGGFSEFVVVPAQQAIRVPAAIPPDRACLLGCAVMTGAGAVFNTAKLQPGENIAVVGLGGVGMNALFAAVAAGAERIVAVDTNAEKLRLAKEWGATDVFLAGNADCAKAVRDATDGGLDTVIETAGTVPAMALAYDICCRGGSVFSAGLPAQDAKFSYLHAELVSAEKSIRGSYMGSCVAERDIPRFLGLYKRGKLPVDKLKAGNVSLEQINEGFDRLAEGTVLRQILRPNG